MKFLRKLAARQQEKYAISIITKGKVMSARIHPCRNSSMRIVHGLNVAEIKWSFRTAILKLTINGVDLIRRHPLMKTDAILKLVLTLADQQVSYNRQSVAKDIPFDDSLPLSASSSDMAKWAASRISRTGYICDRTDEHGFGTIIYHGQNVILELKTLEKGMCAGITINNLAVFTMPSDVDHVASALKARIIRDNRASDISTPTHIKIAA